MIRSVRKTSEGFLCCSRTHVLLVPLFLDWDHDVTGLSVVSESMLLVEYFLRFLSLSILVAVSFERRDVLQRLGAHWRPGTCSFGGLAVVQCVPPAGCTRNGSTL